MHAVKGKQGNIIDSLYDIFQVSEEFYTELCRSKITLEQKQQWARFGRLEDATADEVRKVISVMPREAAGDDRLTANFAKNWGLFIQKNKLHITFSA